MLTPLQAYDLSAEQKARAAADHERAILAAYRDAGGPAASLADGYRELVMRLGVRRVDPAAPDFEAKLLEFHRHYMVNFPIPSEQETLDGLRALWSAPPTAEGYEERGYSVICPLTGRYLMGLDFTIQPASDSLHFIYGFIMPWARGKWGLSRALVDFMRTVGGERIQAHFAAAPQLRPPSFHRPRAPLILFEKNVLSAMTLAELLTDTTGVDIVDPPLADADLSASGVSQSVRDAAWHRGGARRVDYRYLQSSLDGVVDIAGPAREDVVRMLAGPADEADGVASAQLSSALAGRLPGCTTLELCAFTADGGAAIPAEQVRAANRIFQSISVAKDRRIERDVYFEAQMRGLQQNTVAGAVRLLPIGDGASSFRVQEALTRRLLGVLSWEDIRAAPERSYGSWLREKSLAGG